MSNEPLVDDDLVAVAGGSDSRRLARETAVRVLYEVDVVNHPPGEVLARWTASESCSRDAARRTSRLVQGVIEHKMDIDARIRLAAAAWPLDQMPAIEKSILRVALFEILFNNGRAPVRVAINEAVELAKIFGSESSPRFINGVLSSVAATLAEAATIDGENVSVAPGDRSAPTDADAEIGREPG